MSPWLKSYYNRLILSNTIISKKLLSICAYWHSISSLRISIVDITKNLVYLSGIIMNP
ncbi:hypothetical protein NVIRPANT_00920 [Pantoea sp. Nvir]|nr:hypothetical protein NVIRPANT_00920 [Pantoea sp. Nvir]